MTLNAAMMQSERQDWCTPAIVFEALAPLGPIALDPCGSDAANVPAAVIWVRELSDGLAESWRLDDDGRGRALGLRSGLRAAESGLIYVNCPYGPAVKHWMAKCAAEHFEHNLEVVALVAARTDTRWFQSALSTAAAVCFWRGRLTFEGAPSTAPFPSALLYWGNRPSVFTRCLAPFGATVAL